MAIQDTLDNLCSLIKFTSEGLVSEILRLQSDVLRKEILSLFSYHGDADRAALNEYFCNWIDVSLKNGLHTEMLMIAARLDYYRLHRWFLIKGRQEQIIPADISILTKMQDLIFPLCIPRNVIAEAACKMNDSSIATMTMFATGVGPELLVAQMQQRSSCFHALDDGSIVGKNSLRFCPLPIGCQDPENLARFILLDLAGQLYVDLDEEIERDGVVSFLKKKFLHNKECPRFYCILKIKIDEVIIKALTSIRKVLPEFVFYELHRGASKAHEEVILNIIVDRLSET